MEPITWGLILNGLTAIALKGIEAVPGEIVGGGAYAGVCAGYKAFTDYLKQDGKLVNHDLQKAVRRSFLSALQSIALECREEGIGQSRKVGSRGMVTYLPQDRPDLEWLDRKLKLLADELRQVEQAEFVGTSIESLNEVELLLTPQGGLAEERIQIVKQELLDEALREGSIPCYEQKAKQANTGLFERMCAYFAFEIKNNSVVRAIFEGQLLAQINVNLQGQRLTIENLEVSLRAQVLGKLDKLEVAVQEGNSKLDQGFGNVLASLEEIKVRQEQVKEGIPPSVGLERQQDEEMLPRSGVVEFVGRSHS